VLLPVFEWVGILLFAAKAVFRSPLALRGAGDVIRGGRVALAGEREPSELGEGESEVACGESTVAIVRTRLTSTSASKLTHFPQEEGA